MTSAPRRSAALNRSWLVRELVEQRTIFLEHVVGLIDLLPELRVEHASRIEIGVGAVGELGDGADPVRGIERHDGTF